MRTFEEIANDVGLASSINDAEALLRCAMELTDLDTPQAHAMANGARGWAVYLKGDYDEALQQYHRALAFYEELGDSLGVARMIGSIGNIHDKIGDYATALEFYHRALAIHESLGDHHGMARTIGNIGIVYQTTGDYPAALEQYHRALDIHEERGDRSSAAGVTANIGLAYTRIGENQVALEYFHRALAINEEVGDISGMANVTGNIGNAYANTGNNDAALEHYQRALAVHKEIGARRGIAATMCNIVKSYLDRGSNAEAQTYFEAIDVMQIDEPDIRVAREYHRATLQERGGDADCAASTLQHALTEAIGHGLRSETADIHKALRDLALQQNDLKRYVEHSNELSRIIDEINGKDTATKLAIQVVERRVATERQEHQKHLAILHATLPEHVADRVARGEQVSDRYDNAAVMFLDIIGFTFNTSHMPPNDVVNMLDEIFRSIDRMCDEHGVVKVKTIGDSYMCFRGDADAMTNARYVANVALDVLKKAFSWPNGDPLRVRLGLHIGPATAGVIGTQRLQYDVWGDTVNVASRMESTSEPGRIHVTEEFARALTADPLTADSLTLFERGIVEIKGKGAMNTYWLEGA